MHVGLVDSNSSTWTAGGIYTRVVALTLLKAGGLPPGARLSVIGEGSSVNDLNLPRVALPPRPRNLLPRLQVRGARVAAAASIPWQLRVKLGLVDRWNLFHVAKAAGIDVLLPVRFVAEGDEPTDVGVVGWVPDFQHRLRPEFFSKTEHATIEADVQRLIRSSRVMLASSEDVARHLTAHYQPPSGGVVVARFPSIFVFEPPAPPDVGVLKRFGIPEKFVLVCNQVWKHKNHQVLVDAWSLLKQRKENIPLVIVGTPSDYRDPRNSAVSALLQGLAEHQLTGTVTFLGEVSRQELHTLLQSAALLIQPSKFEGWSTSVQDAKALGLPLLCSDLPVHREQAPSALGFFSPEDHHELASLLTRAWPSLAPGQRLVRPSRAPEPASEFAAALGRAVGLAQRRHHD